MPRRSLPLSVAALALAACEGASPPTAVEARPGARPSAARATAASPIDLSGSWVWREEVILQVPTAFAALFAVQPEGPVTIGRCVISGTMQLVQDGAAFEGSATQTSRCVSRGGQVFSPLAFTPTLDIREGEIRGRSLRVVFGAGDVPCLYHAVITEIVDGTATALRGGGRCIPPGHPQSPLSALGLPFPSGPISPTVVWEATRQ